MKRKAKKNNNIFTKGMIWRIVYQGIMVGTLALLAFSIGCNFNYTDTSSMPVAQTMAFAVLAISELVHVFNIRSNKESIFKIGFGTNKMLLLANFVSFLLVFLVLEVPFLQKIFDVAQLNMAQWLWVAILSIAPLIIVEIFKLLKINTIKDE